MVRPVLTTGLILLLAAPAALAGPLDRRQAAVQASPVPYPRLATVALVTGPSSAPGAPPMLREGGLAAAPGAWGLKATAATFSYIGAGFTPIGAAVPPTIRAAHLVLNGSPYEGRPAQTALWLASPMSARVRDWSLDRRGVVR